MASELPVLVESRGLSKVYVSGIWALRPVDFQVPQGTRAAIIGANGAGKTTLLNLLLGTISPSAGQIYWFQCLLSEILPDLYARVAFVPEQHVFYPKWTGEETIRFVRSFYRDWDSRREFRLRELLAIPLNQRVGTYSKGNLVRLSLLLALSQGAPVLLLDEPFSGLDPLVREEILRLVGGQMEKVAPTLILTSHDLFAVELLAEDLWVLHKGSFIYHGRLDEFLASYRCFLLEAAEEAALADLPSEFFVREAGPRAGAKQFHVVAPSNASASLTCLKENVKLVVERPVTLQDAYAACVHLHERQEAKK